MVWYNSGRLKEQRFYVNGKLDSTFADYYENGQKKSRMQYHNGKLDGLSAAWYPTGEIQMRCNYDRNRRNGCLIAYYPSGKKHREIYYKDGEMDGFFTEYYPNGKKKTKRNFEQGLPAGNYYEWDENGKLKAKGTSEQVPDELEEVVDRSWLDGPEMPKDTATLYQYADEMPSFPGGIIAFHSYSEKHLIHPDRESERGITGTVVVSFVVEKNGSLSAVKVTKSIHHNQAFNKAALRFVNDMPAWSPGKIKDTSVRVKMSLPLKF
jgi:protein TonB